MIEIASGFYFRIQNVCGHIGDADAITDISLLCEGNRDCQTVQENLSINIWRGRQLLFETISRSSGGAETDVRIIKSLIRKSLSSKNSWIRLPVTQRENSTLQSSAFIC